MSLEREIDRVGAGRRRSRQLGLVYFLRKRGPEQAPTCSTVAFGLAEPQAARKTGSARSDAPDEANDRHPHGQIGAALGEHETKERAWLWKRRAPDHWISSDVGVTFWAKAGLPAEA